MSAVAATVTPWKRCRCCGRTLAPQEWQELPYVGLQRFEDEALEYRQCPGSGCRSTLCLAVPMETTEK